MKRFWVLPAVLILSLGVTALCPAAGIPELEEAAKSVVEVRSGALAMTSSGRLLRMGSTAAGVVIHPDGWIVTCAHVVGSRKKALIVFKDGTEVQAQVVRVLPESDLALLKVSKSGLPSIRPSQAKIGLHAKVYTIGGSKLLSDTISQGQITGIVHAGQYRVKIPLKAELFQVSFSIYHGDSGTPLLDENADLLGIMTAAVKSRNRVSYAVPASAIHRILRGLAVWQ